MLSSTLLVLAFTCALSWIAAFLAWWWWMPLFRRISHTPIDAHLKRLGEIGFDDNLVRYQLFLVELAILGGLAIGTAYYFGSVFGFVILAILFHLRTMIVTWIIDRRERLLRSQTLALCIGLHGLVRSGLNLPVAIVSVAKEIPAPLGIQISKVASSYQLGRPLAESITEARSSLRLDAFSLLVTSITCSLKHGTPLGDALSGVRESLEHRDAAERQMSAKTSSSRTSIFILGCSPLALMGLFYIFMPDSMPYLFFTPQGKFVLAMIVGLLYVGVAWAKALCRIK